MGTSQKELDTETEENNFGVKHDSGDQNNSHIEENNRLRALIGLPPLKGSVTTNSAEKENSSKGNSKECLKGKQHIKKKKKIQVKISPKKQPAKKLFKCSE